MSLGQEFRSYCQSCEAIRTFTEIEKANPSAIVTNDGRHVLGVCHGCNGNKHVVRAR